MLSIQCLSINAVNPLKLIQFHRAWSLSHRIGNIIKFPIIHKTVFLSGLEDYIILHYILSLLIIS